MHGEPCAGWHSGPLVRFERGWIPPRVLNDSFGSCWCKTDLAMEEGRQACCARAAYFGGRILPQVPSNGAGKPGLTWERVPSFADICYGHSEAQTNGRTHWTAMGQRLFVCFVPGTITLCLLTQ